MSISKNKIQELVLSNAEYAKSFNGTFTMAKIRELGQASDSMPTAILTCVDPRCVPEAFFGPNLRQPVFRNAGGRATGDAVRTLNILRPLTNIKMVLVIHHTDCGMGVVTEAEIHEFSKSKNPDAAAAVKEIDFRLWEEENLDETVKEDVRKLREEKTLSGLEVCGYVLETQKGLLRQVEI